jgi:hypothetical protein
VAATGLAFATGVLDSRTVLLDASTRVGSVEFHLGANPALNLAMLARRAEEAEDPAAWEVLLESDLQPMGAPSQGRVLCGITKPALRTRVTGAAFASVVGALRERFRFVFLVGSGSGWTVDDPEVDRLALQVADRILLVVRPDVQGVTLARRALQDWPARDRVHLVLNQVGLPAQLSRGRSRASSGRPSWRCCLSTPGEWRKRGRATDRSSASGAAAWPRRCWTWRAASRAGGSSCRPTSCQRRSPGGSGWRWAWRGRSGQRTVL